MNAAVLLGLVGLMGFFTHKPWAFPSFWPNFPCHLLSRPMAACQPAIAHCLIGKPSGFQSAEKETALQKLGRNTTYRNAAENQVYIVLHVKSSKPSDSKKKKEFQTQDWQILNRRRVLVLVLMHAKLPLAIHDPSLPVELDPVSCVQSLPRMAAVVQEREKEKLNQYNKQREFRRRSGEVSGACGAGIAHGRETARASGQAPPTRPSASPTRTSPPVAGAMAVPTDRLRPPSRPRAAAQDVQHRGVRQRPLGPQHVCAAAGGPRAAAPQRITIR